MQKSLFDVEEIAMKCESCGAEIDDPSDLRADEFCVSCYENAECPGYCSDEHDAPEPDESGQWVCPCTEDVYTIDDCEWEVQGRYPDSSTYIDAAREWYIYPNDHGYSYCAACDEWRDSDDITFDRYGDERGCMYCDEGSDEYGGECPSSDVVSCDVCHARHAVITHWNPLTERVSCASCATGEPIPVAA